MKMNEMDARMCDTQVVTSKPSTNQDKADMKFPQNVPSGGLNNGSSHRRQIWMAVFCIALVSIASPISSLALSGPILNFINVMLPRAPISDLGHDIEYFITSRGFEFREHELTTEDGYIITFHQLFHKKFSNTSRRAVVFGVPLFGNSALFVLENNTVAFQLAAAGFDVWLTNGRGNRFGQRHISLDPVKDRALFFDYTYVEQGSLDLAAHIDYILQYTQQKKVFYVGMSQGAASYFALLSKKPEYNEKIEKAVSYGGFRSICFATDPTVGTLTHLRWPMGDIMRPYFGSVLWNEPLLSDVCSRLPRFCTSYMIHGVRFRSEHYISLARVPVYLEHFPDGSSFKNLIFYSQSRGMGCDGSSREFDYDGFAWTKLKIFLGLADSENERRYGTREPPVLNPSNIKVPTKMYFSDGDDLAPPKEAYQVAKDVGIPDNDLHYIPDVRFTHFHFFFNERRNDFIEHTIDYFRGIETTWIPSDHESYRTVVA